MVNNEIRKQKIREIPEEMFLVYTSTELTKAIKQSLLTYQISNKDAFIDCVGDTIIKLSPRVDFEKNLVAIIGISTESASKISLDFKQFFDKAEGIVHPEANLETKERLELRPQPTTGAPVEAGKAREDTAAAKPLTREELMSALGGKRTMAADIEALRQKREADKAGTTPPQTKAN